MHGGGASVARGRAHSRMSGPHAAETVTRRTNRKPINGLAHACAGYPQACQQNLWVSGAAHGRHVCAGRDVHRRGVVMRSAAKRWPRWPSPGPRLHHACQSPSDQGFSVAVRRISTSLPTFSVEKSGCAREAWDTRECHALPRCVRALTQCRCRPRRLSGTGAGSRRRTGRQPDGEPGMREGRAKRCDRFADRAVRPAPLHGRARRRLIHPAVPSSCTKRAEPDPSRTPIRRAPLYCYGSKRASILETSTGLRVERIVVGN